MIIPGADQATSLTDVILGASFTGLGGAVVLIYGSVTKRISKLEKRSDAHLALLLRIAVKVGVEDQIINDVQEAIRSGS